MDQVCYIKGIFCVLLPSFAGQGGAKVSERFFSKRIFCFGNLSLSTVYKNNLVFLIIIFTLKVHSVLYKH